MINSATREAQAGLNILGLEVGKISQHLVDRQATGQEIENVGHPDSHPTDAGAPPALLWIHRDSLLQLCHSILLVLTTRRAALLKRFGLPVALPMMLWEIDACLHATPNLRAAARPKASADASVNYS